ncbi:MAG: TIGR03364 family FAD-dependent oxidoreductase [Bacteroidota bacterium]|nr:TIGR03364 family FAD-dependent oxidoreductase [Bacteroidota bacterium]
MSSSAIIVGAGIVGLATARALSIRGYKVTVIERSSKAVGASVRNFGMVWPVGQPDGVLYERAMKSRSVWKSVADSIGFWYDECGSLHTAYYEDEWQVLQELYDAFKANGRPVQLLSKKDVLEKFNGVNENELIGGLYSATELIVDPRVAITSIADYLKEFLEVEFIWDAAVTEVQTGKVKAGNTIIQADLICICSGADFETLYPEMYKQQQLTKCKLQMLRFAPLEHDWRIGTAVCGGLSLIHYNSFKVAPSLPVLKERYSGEMSEYLQWGIHVMVSQNEKGELTVGDSHEYGLTFDPFDQSFINELIIQYLRQFMICNDWKLVQSWNGIYPKSTVGQTEIFVQAEQGVYVVNGLSGAGMTLSFGLAEELVEKM